MEQNIEQDIEDIKKAIVLLFTGYGQLDDVQRRELMEIIIRLKGSITNSYISMTTNKITMCIPNCGHEGHDFTKEAWEEKLLNTCLELHGRTPGTHYRVIVKQIRSLIKSERQAEREEIVSKYGDFRQEGGQKRTLRFYLTPHTEHGEKEKN